MQGQGEESMRGKELRLAGLLFLYMSVRNLDKKSIWAASPFLNMGESKWRGSTK